MPTAWPLNMMHLESLSGLQEGLILEAGGLLKASVQKGEKYHPPFNVLIFFIYHESSDSAELAELIFLFRR